MSKGLKELLEASRELAGCDWMIEAVYRDQWEAIQARAQKAIEGAQEPTWVSVEERLPEDGQLVVMYAPYPKEYKMEGMFVQEVVVYSNGAWLRQEEYVSNRGTGGYHPATYWMPLPTPPKGVE